VTSREEERNDEKSERVLSVSRRFGSASVEDLLEVCRWIRSRDECELWVGKRLEFPIDESTAAAALEFELASSWKLLEAESQRIVAFGQIVPKLDGRLHLARLIVDPGSRATGIGRLLANELLREARETGGRLVSLNVSATNLAAIGLYRSLGFGEAERPADEPASTSLYLESSP